MSAENTKSLQEIFDNLEKTRGNLSSQPPNLDSILPIFESAEKDSATLLEYIQKTKKVIQEKRNKKQE